MSGKGKLTKGSACYDCWIHMRPDTNRTGVQPGYTGMKEIHRDGVELTQLYLMGLIS